MAEALRLSLDEMNARLVGVPGAKRFSLDDLNAQLAGPPTPQPDVSLLQGDTWAQGQPQSFIGTPFTPILTPQMRGLVRRDDAITATQQPPQPAPFAITPQTRSLIGRELETERREIANEPTAGEYLMAQGREAYANSLAGQGLLNARSGAIEKSRADMLDRIIANARQQGSNVGVPLPPITDKTTGMPLSDPNREAAELVGDYVGVSVEDLEHKAKTARARYNVQSRPVLEAERQRQEEFAAMPPARGLLKQGASAIGMLAGSAPSPESLIPVGRGTSLLGTFLKGAAANAAITAATDPLVQQNQVATGLRQAFDPTQTVFSALASGAIGGTLNVAPDFLLPIVRQLAAKLRKAPEQVTVGELATAIESEPPAAPAGAQAPPPATTMGPTGEMPAPASPGAVAESVSRPRSPFVEHRISTPQPQSQPVYTGAVRGPSFETTGRADPVTPTPAPANPRTPSGEIVVTPRGRKIGAQYEVVELDSLIPSHTDDLTVNPRFPAELQPRARERAASQAQVAEIAGNLEPALLGRSASAAEGAPIIGPDGVVESGNGRVLALSRAYGQGMPGAEKYRAWLQEQGFNIEGMTAPVLVRRRTTELSPSDRQAFTREANERTTPSMSSAEQAGADAKAMPGYLTDLYRGGELSTGNNREFIRKFIDSVVSTSERGGMYDKNGALSQDGLRRTENALFAKAYNDTSILGRLREDADTNIRAIGNAMVDAAPAWLQLRADVAGGLVRPEMDITPAVIEAANLVGTARKQGVPVSDLINQVDMFGGPPPELAGILRLMFRDAELRKPVARQKLRDALTYYATQARKTSAGPTLDFGEAAVNPADILDLASNRGNAGLFPSGDEGRSGEALFSRTPSGQRRLSLDDMNARLSRASGGSKRVTLEQLNSQLNAAPPGANYVGAVTQVYDPAVARTTGDPIRREAILKDLMTSLGMALYQGRIKSRKILGFFRPRTEETRIKNMGDIETAAHEIAHLLDYRIPEIRRQWNPATKANAAIRAELAGVSYDASKLFEGYAEFVRLWSTQPAQAQARAPNFFRWWESFIGRSEYGPALRLAQKRMLDWFNQAAIDRARSKIGEGPEINAGLVGPWDKFRQNVTDDLTGIMRAEMDLTGKLSPVGPYETARLTRGKAAVIEGALTMGVPVVNPDGSHSFKGKGLQQILKPVTSDLDDFLMYSVGRAAAELKQQGRENLFNAAEIKGMLALERPEFRKAFAEYQDWNKGILDFAEAKGVIDPVARSYWQRTNYLPFYRVSQSGPGGKGTVPGDWSGIKALRGGTGNLRPIMQNIVQNASMLIDAALTNEARVKVANLVNQKGGARFMVKIPKEEKGVAVHSSEVERAILDALGVKSAKQLKPEEQAVVDQIVSNMGGFIRFIMRGQKPFGPNVIAVLRGGKPEFYEVADPLLYRALTALNREPAHWITRILGMPKRVGQMTITLTPDFMAANAVRDTLSGFVMSRHGFRPLIDTASGFVSRLKSDASYREYIANGGGFSSHLLDEGNYRKHLERFYTRRGINYRTVLDAPDKLFFALERVANAFEMATRIGEYKRAIARGEHPRHAAYSAREVSTDFAMRGDDKVMGFLYDTVIFLKAGVNGMDRLYRGLTQDPNKLSIAAKTGMIALFSAGLYAVNRGNPLYEQLEDWDRDTNWHLFIPKPETYSAWSQDREPPALEDRYWHFRVPKIWEIGAMGSIAERQVAGVLDKQAGKAQIDSLNIIRNLFQLEWLPQALAPLYELAINRERFTGRQIETQAMQELEPWARTSPYSSQTVRAYGEAIRHLPRSLQIISPAQFEHLLQGYFNTWALYGLTLTDAAFFDERPDMRWDQLPVMRRFFRQEPAQQTRYLTELYDAIDAATEVRRTMRQMDTRWRPEIADELEKREDNALYGQLNFADQRLRTFRKEMEGVYLAPDLPALQKMVQERAKVTRQPGFVAKAQNSGAWNDVGALKRLLIDDIIRERNAFAETIVRDVDTRRGELRAGATP